MGFWDNAKSYAKKPMARSTAPQSDPLMDLLNSMSAPSSNDLYSDAYNQVTGAYNAQLENLDADARNAQKRQKQGDRQLDAMYDALAKEIGADSKDIDKMYRGARANSSQISGRAIKGIEGIYDNSNRELAGLLKGLGIEDAAPDAMGGSAKDKALAQSLVRFRDAGSQQAFEIDRTAGLQYNTAQKNIAGLTGNNRRADLRELLENRLGEIGQQKNTVQGQMADALFQRQYQLEQDATQRQMQLQQMLYEAAASQQAAAAENAPSSAEQYNQMGPSERSSFKASQMFGPQMAPYVMELISGVANYQNRGVYQNPGHFIRSVLAENQKQAANAGQPLLPEAALEALASFYYDQGAVGRKNPSAYYPGMGG